MQKNLKSATPLLAGYLTLTVAAWATPALAVIDVGVGAGDYLKIWTKDQGALGQVNEGEPGIIYDPTGQGDFTSGVAYLAGSTVGEGFALGFGIPGTAYRAVGGALVGGGDPWDGELRKVVSTNGDTTIEWSGSYAPYVDSNSFFNLVNVVGFAQGDNRITMTTTITAVRDLTWLRFSRYIQPYADPAGGASSPATYVRGASNLVYAQSTSGAVIGLSTDAASSVYTSITSSTPDPMMGEIELCPSSPVLVNGGNVMILTYDYIPLAAGQSVTYTYYYIFGEVINGAIEWDVEGRSVVSAVDAMRNSPAFWAARVIDATPDLLALFSDAGLSSDQELSDAANQTLPLLVGATPRATQNIINTINRIIQARQAYNRGLSSGDDFYGDSHLWMKPFGAWANQQSDASVAGFTSDTYGATFGVDGTVANNWRLGAAFAYATSDVESKDSVAQQGADIDLLQLVGYGSHSLDDQTEINFLFGVGQNQVDGYRNIDFASSVAAADYDSSVLFAGLGLNRTYRLTEKTSITPSVRADYIWIRDESYTENGAGLLNLDVDDRTTDSLVIGIDGKLVHDLNEQFALTVNLGVGYDTLSEQDSITATFVGAPGASFATYGFDPSPWIEHGGIGAEYKTKSGMELTARYDVEFRDDFLNQAASLKVRWIF